MDKNLTGVEYFFRFSAEIKVLFSIYAQCRWNGHVLLPENGVILENSTIPSGLPGDRFGGCCRV